MTTISNHPRLWFSMGLQVDLSAQNRPAQGKFWKPPECSGTQWRARKIHQDRSNDQKNEDFPSKVACELTKMQHLVQCCSQRTTNLHQSRSIFPMALDYGMGFWGFETVTLTKKSAGTSSCLPGLWWSRTRRKSLPYCRRWNLSPERPKPMTQGPKDASTDSTEDKSWIPKVALGFWNSIRLCVISWFINPINYSYKYHKP